MFSKTKLFSKTVQKTRSVTSTIINQEAINNINVLYRTLEKLNRPVTPLVVITCIDKISNNQLEQIVNLLNQSIHQNNIVLIANPKDWVGDLTSNTKIACTTIVESLIAKQEKLLLFKKDTEIRSTHKTTNVLFIGPQHAGKSSLNNTLLKYFEPRIVTAKCDVGRSAEVGTVYYSKNEVPHSKMVFFDIAGRPFEQGSTHEDLCQLQKLMKGLPTGTDLIAEAQWINQSDEKNSIDQVVLVVNASTLLKQVTKEETYSEEETGCIIC